MSTPKATVMARNAIFRRGKYAAGLEVKLSLFNTVLCLQLCNWPSCSSVTGLTLRLFYARDLVDSDLIFASWIWRPNYLPSSPHRSENEAVFRAFSMWCVAPHGKLVNLGSLQHNLPCWSSPRPPASSQQLTSRRDSCVFIFLPYSNL